MFEHIINKTTGAATSANQATLESLVETLQELISRLAVLSAVKGVNESLRVTPISMPSTAVTGPITSALSIAEKALGGISYTQRTAIENMTAVLANINNTTGV